MIDIQDFMELYYGYRPISFWTVEEFNSWKASNEVEQWDYPLDEYVHLAENNVKAVPVRFTGDWDGYDYRFCELPL